MPLSEHEQRVLEQMEHAMEAEDPRFATAMRGRTPKARQRRRFLLGGLGLVLGLILVVLGVAQGAVALAVVGFVLMIVAGALAATPPRRLSTTNGPIGAVGADGRTRPRRQRPKRTRHSGTFMERIEQRWDRRNQRDSGY